MPGRPSRPPHNEPPEHRAPPWALNRLLAQQPRRSVPAYVETVCGGPMHSSIDMINEALARLPETILSRSGAVFYSGRGAFSLPRRLYILGLNPGGSPQQEQTQTVGRDIEQWSRMPPIYSRYVDESWCGKAPGTHGMQPKIRHMFEKLGIDPRCVPASNLVFVRSNNEASVAAETSELMHVCWPVHRAVIDAVRADTILCLRGTAGQWVRHEMGASQRIDSFVESNRRGWTSEAHITPDGRAVITVTHPGRADWRNPNADPTALVQRVLAR